MLLVNGCAYQGDLPADRNDSSKDRYRSTVWEETLGPSASSLSWVATQTDENFDR